MRMLLPAIVAAALAVGACGGGEDAVDEGPDATLEEAATEMTLGEALGDASADPDERLAVESVRCPADAELTADATFTCEISGDTASGPVEVTVNDAESGEISYQADLSGSGGEIERSGRAFVR